MPESTRIIPLGGLGEVGKNMTVIECDDGLVVIDAGLSFPRDEHLGVDLILPDFGYLADKQIRAVVLTHAHEDHVGGLPYLMREVRVAEVWATRLTLGLVKSKLDEHGLLRSTELREADPEEPIELGPFRLEFVRMAHSVPDAVGIAIEADGVRDWARRHHQGGETLVAALGDRYPLVIFHGDVGTGKTASAEAAADRILSLPLSPTLTNEQVERVSKVLDSAGP